MREIYHFFWIRSKKQKPAILIRPKKHILNDSHTNQDNKGNVRAHLHLEHVFGFCKTFKKWKKWPRFELQPETSNEEQNVSYTTLVGSDVDVTINSLSLFTPSIVLSPEQQKSLNESIKSNFTLSFDPWLTEGKPVNTGIEYQLDVGSASIINVVSYLIPSHQKYNVTILQDPQISLTTRILINLIWEDIYWDRRYSISRGSNQDKLLRKQIFKAI